jgi:hypothetical protein
MSKKKIVVTQGHCPKCGADGLDYGAADWRDGAIDFPFTCKDCDFSGTENYIMEFTGFEGPDYKFYEEGSVIEGDK